MYSALLGARSFSRFVTIWLNVCICPIFSSPMRFDDVTVVTAASLLCRYLNFVPSMPNWYQMLQIWDILKSYVSTFRFTNSKLLNIHLKESKIWHIKRQLNPIRIRSDTPILQYIGPVLKDSWTRWGHHFHCHCNLTRISPQSHHNLTS